MWLNTNPLFFPVWWWDGDLTSTCHHYQFTEFLSLNHKAPDNVSSWMFALAPFPPRPKQSKCRAYWERRRSMGNSFSLQHSPRFLRTPSMGFLVSVVIQLGGEKKVDFRRWKRMSKGQTQITASFSDSIISCIAQLIMAYVCRLHFLRFQKSDVSMEKCMSQWSNKRTVLYIILTGKISRFLSPFSDSVGPWDIANLSQITASVLCFHLITPTFSQLSLSFLTPRMTLQMLKLTSMF